MKIIKKNKGNFTIISNQILFDKDLSYKAIGLFVQMWALPEGWNYTIKGFTSLHTDGESSVSSAIKELERAGYLTRTKIKDEKGFFDMEYTLKMPDLNEKPTLEKPISEKPTSDFPVLEYPVYNKVLKDKVLNNKRNNNMLIKNQDIVKVLSKFGEIYPTNKSYYGNKQHRSAIEFLIQEYDLERVLEVIEMLPDLVKKIPYFPTITNALELKEKWDKIPIAVGRAKHTFEKNTRIVN